MTFDPYWETIAEVTATEFDFRGPNDEPIKLGSDARLAVAEFVDAIIEWDPDALQGTEPLILSAEMFERQRRHPVIAQDRSGQEALAKFLASPNATENDSRIRSTDAPVSIETNAKQAMRRAE